MSDTETDRSAEDNAASDSPAPDEAPPTNKSHAQALTYHQLGWSIVPVHAADRLNDGAVVCRCSRGAECSSKGKHPAAAWTRFQHERLTVDEVTNWFADDHYGIGIVTGEISGIFVVDEDAGPGKLGADTLQALQMRHGDLPTTVTAITGGGGRHFLFRHPGFQIRTATDVLGPGVDVRGDGGFIVAPPSPHASGRKYAWIAGLGPEELEVAEAPPWLLDRLRGDAPITASSAPRAEPIRMPVERIDGKVDDGRDGHMLSIASASILNLMRALRRPVTADEVLGDAWPAYEGSTAARGESLDADGRGRLAMSAKIINQLKACRTGAWAEAHAVMMEVTTAWSDGVEAPMTARDIDPYSYRLDSLAVGEPPVQRFLLQPLMPLGTVGLVFGPGGVGKSMLALDLCLSVARRAAPHAGGRSLPCMDLLNGLIPDEAGGAAVFLTFEDDTDEIHRRAVALDPTNTRDGVPCYVIPGLSLPGFDPELVVAAGRNAGLTDFAKNGLDDLLTRTATEAGHPVRLLVLDPAGDFIGGDENDAQFVKPLMRLLREVAARHGCTIILLGHVAKAMNEDALSMRGSSAWLANSRFGYALWRPTEKDSEKLAKEVDEPAESLVWGCLVKANHAGAPVSTKRLFCRDANTGRLLDIKRRLAPENEADENEGLLPLLVEACQDYAAAGVPFTVTGDGGLYKGREDLLPEFSVFTRDRFDTLATMALERKLLVKARGSASPTASPKFLDVPDGPLAKGAAIANAKFRGSRRKALALYRQTVAGSA